MAGAQRKEAQDLQWFLSESTWEPDEINARRLQLLDADPKSAPDEHGVLVIDEHGDRKWGKKTALASPGKAVPGQHRQGAGWSGECL